MKTLTERIKSHPASSNLSEESVTVMAYRMQEIIYKMKEAPNKTIYASDLKDYHKQQIMYLGNYVNLKGFVHKNGIPAFKLCEEI